MIFQAGDLSEYSRHDTRLDRNAEFHSEKIYLDVFRLSESTVCTAADARQRIPNRTTRYVKQIQHPSSTSPRPFRMLERTMCGLCSRSHANGNRNENEYEPKQKPKKKTKKMRKRENEQMKKR